MDTYTIISSIIAAVLGGKEVYKFIINLNKIDKAEKEKLRQVEKNEREGNRREKDSEKKDTIQYLVARVEILEKEKTLEKKATEERIKEKDYETNKLTFLVMESVMLLQESLGPKANKAHIRSKTDDIIKELELLKEFTLKHKSEDN